MVCFDDSREEFFDKSVVRYGVDVEDPAEEMVGRVEYRVAIDNACIEEQHAWVTVLLPDLCSG